VTRYLFFSFVVILLFCTSVLYAQEPLTFSLDDAVLQAVEYNLGLKIERFNPLITAQSILKEEGAFDPALNIELNQAFQKGISPTTVDSQEQRATTMSTSLTGKIPTGTNYKLAWDYQKVRGDSTYLIYNPYYLTNLSLTLNQPVLRGLGTTNQMTPMRVARKNFEIAGFDFMRKAEELVNATIKAFYDVLLAQEGLVIAKFSLSLGEKILYEVQSKYKAGFTVEVDLYNAEAEVAKRQETLLSAEAALKDALDVFRKILGLEDFDQEITLSNSDAQPSEPPGIEESLQEAQFFRVDLQQALTELEKKKMLTKYYKNQRLPDLELFAGAGPSGLAGSKSGAFDRLDDRSDYTWKIGFSFQMPLFLKEAKSNYNKARYEEEQAEVSMNELTQRITVEVRQAWRSVYLSIKKIDASKKTRLYSEKRFHAEERRYQEGYATLNDVLKFQEEFVRSLFNEKKSEHDYHIAYALYGKTKGTLLMQYGISDAELGITDGG
jgi:outer membrane protein TolC